MDESSEAADWRQLVEQAVDDDTISEPEAAIITRCLMPSPADRFPTAASMAAALQEMSR